jgi:hypothetical protein
MCGNAGDNAITDERATLMSQGSPPHMELYAGGRTIGELAGPASIS